MKNNKNIKNILTELNNAGFEEVDISPSEIVKLEIENIGDIDYVVDYNVVDYYKDVKKFISLKNKNIDIDTYDNKLGKSVYYFIAIDEKFEAVASSGNLHSYYLINKKVFENPDVMCDTTSKYTNDERMESMSKHIIKLIKEIY